MATTVESCPTCGEPVLAEDRFCEACGADLPTDDAAATASPTGDPTSEQSAVDDATPHGCRQPDCDGTYVAGWCDTCGSKQPDPRDHVEFDEGPIGAVTDRGQKHHRNEDAVALARLDDGTFVATVCDGVSSTVSPHVASQAAADASVSALTAAPHDLAAAYDRAAEAAAGVEARPHPDLGAPSCTYLAATVRPGRVELATLGDCRAYWVDDNGARQLSHDDSWAQHAIDAGTDPTEAHADARAHVITRWLGSDADPEWRPHESALDVTDEGLLVLCSDGLWNYLEDPGHLATLIDEATTGTTDAASGGAGAVPAPVDIARSLVEFANDRGGHDNITVAVLRCTPASTTPEEPQ